MKGAKQRHAMLPPTQNTMDHGGNADNTVAVAAERTSVAA